MTVNGPAGGGPPPPFPSSGATASSPQPARRAESAATAAAATARRMRPPVQSLILGSLLGARPGEGPRLGTFSTVELLDRRPRHLVLHAGRQRLEVRGDLPV